VALTGPTHSSSSDIFFVELENKNSHKQVFNNCVIGKGTCYSFSTSLHVRESKRQLQNRRATKQNAGPNIQYTSVSSRESSNPPLELLQAAKPAPPILMEKD